MRALVAALELTLVDPAWWAVAAAGFLARGGALLFGGVLLELPSPITVTLIFGLDSVTGTGDPTTRLLATIAGIAAVALVGAIGAVLIGAWVDAAAFARVRASRTVSRATPDIDVAARRGDGARNVLGLAWLQALGLLPGIAVLALAAPAVRDVAVGELLLPSSSDVPFILRVIAGAQGPLLRAVLVLAAGEALVTIATRLYLGGGARASTSQAYAAAIRWIVRRPIVAFATWLVGWAALLGALVPGLWAVALAWGELRSALLNTSLPFVALGGPCPVNTACGDPVSTMLGLIGAVGAGVLFVTVWIAAIVLVGLASGFRASLWTMAVGAQPATAAIVQASPGPSPDARSDAPA
jgi:hypothetical protein